MKTGLFKSINENKYNNTKLTDYPIGAKVLFDDGEEWMVVKPGVKGGKIFMAPFNQIAKSRYISIAIEFDLNWLNSNVRGINESEVNEGRSQIKRKYGEHGAIRVNSEAPVRNSILEFVGKRFVTKAELDSHLTQLSEDRGKAIDQTKWFSRNMRYFESFTNRGSEVWTLSKYGKRVLENILKARQEKQENNMLKESTTVGLFKFTTINEGFDAKYWEDYHEKSGKINHPNDMKLQQEVSACVEEWNDNNEMGKENEVTSAGEKKVLALAKQFVKAKGWISSDVIDAMIAQES